MTSHTADDHTLPLWPYDDVPSTLTLLHDVISVGTFTTTVGISGVYGYWTETLISDAAIFMEQLEPDKHSDLIRLGNSVTVLDGTNRVLFVVVGKLICTAEEFTNVQVERYELMNVNSREH